MVVLESEPSTAKRPEKFRKWIFSCPDFGHIRLPDLIRSCGFHTAPFFLSSCAQASRAHQQASLAHHPQHSLPIQKCLCF
jgi:hypothetical protein